MTYEKYNKNNIKERFAFDNNELKKLIIKRDLIKKALPLDQVVKSNTDHSNFERLKGLNVDIIATEINLAKLIAFVGDVPLEHAFMRNLKPKFIKKIIFHYMNLTINNSYKSKRELNITYTIINVDTCSNKYSEDKRNGYYTLNNPNPIENNRGIKYFTSMKALFKFIKSNRITIRDILVTSRGDNK